MLFKLSVFLFLCGSLVSTASEKKVVCYFPNWTQWRPKPAKFAAAQVDPTQCTHIISAFSKIGNAKMTAAEQYEKDLFTDLVALKAKNPNLKILTAIGGWNAGVKPFQDIAQLGATTFCESAKAYLLEFKLDGLDWDWEYPVEPSRAGKPQDKADFTEMLRVCREVFDTATPPLLMSAAVAAGGSKLNGYDVPAVAKYLDFINVMTYDMRGAWDHATGHQAALFEFPNERMPLKSVTVANYAQQWVDAGAPKDKLIIGLPFYGRSFTLKSEKTDIGTPASAGTAGRFTKQAGFLGYTEICDMIKKGASVTRYSKQGDVVVAVRKDQWVGYDDVKTMKTKVEWIKKEGYGGAMIWSLDTDDNFGTECGQGKHPLLRAIGSAIGMGGPGAEQGEPLSKCPEIDGNNPTVDDCNKKLMESGTLGNTNDNDNNNDDNDDDSASDGGDRCADQPNGQLLKHLKKCNMYVQCVYGTSNEMFCPGELVFNDAAKACDWKDNVQC